MINNIGNLKKELAIQSKHPHVKSHIATGVKIHVKNVIENELYYQLYGRYPDGEVTFDMPEVIRELAIEIEERLLK